MRTHPGEPDRSGGMVRRPTAAHSSEARQRSFEEEDRRWARGEQFRDWLKLLLMVGLMVGWSLAVYLLEPGLR